MVQNKMSATCTMGQAGGRGQSSSHDPLRVYVTSTPEDFDAERKFLSEIIFPQLKEMCLQRASNFCPVDIRWKPGDGQVTSGHFLRFILDSISKCSPFFISLIGQRYGPYRALDSPKLSKNLKNISESTNWLDKNYLVAISAGYSWLMNDAHQNCSIPELEVLQAAFLCDNDNCHFYFRHSDHLDNKLLDATPREREELCAIYTVENDYADFHIRDLKQRILKRGLKVNYFKTLNELGSFVLTDWTTVINSLYPPLINTGKYLESEEHLEQMCHETFGYMRRKMIVSTAELEAVKQQVTEFVSTALEEPCLMPETPPPDYMSYSMTSVLRQKKPVEARYKSVLVLTGDRGVGKSTLVSSWYQSFLAEDNDVVALIHHVGASEKSIDVAMFMRRCIQKLRETYFYLDGGIPDIETEQPCSFRELSEAFVAAVSLGPCVLVLDGVDELGSTANLTPQEVKKFSWLPLPLPQEFCLICTTCRSDLSFNNLAKRADAKILSVPQLDQESSRIKFLEETMHNKFGLLNKNHHRQVLDIRLSTRPLFLNILRMEMQAFNVYTNLSAYLDNCWETCSSVRDLCAKCVQRWVNEHSWNQLSEGGTSFLDKKNTGGPEDYTGWVPDVLRLLAVSRSGLTEENIFHLLSALGYRGRCQVKQFSWLLFRESLGDFIYERNDGRIIYSHQHVRELVEYMLMRSVKLASAEILTATEQEKFWKEHKKIYHRHLASYFAKQPYSKHKIDELPWQLLMAADVDALHRFLTDPKMVVEFLRDDKSNRRQEFLYYWSILREWDVEPVASYRHLLTELGLPGLQTDSKFDSMAGSEAVRDSWAVKRTPTPFVNVPQIFEIPASDAELSLSLSLSEACTQSSDRDQVPKISEQETPKKIIPATKDDSDDIETIFITEENSENLEFETDCVGVPNKYPTGVMHVAWLILKFLQELGHLNEAEDILKALGDLLYKSYPLSQEGQLLHARVQEQLGSYCLARGEIEPAENWFYKALSILTDLFDIEDHLKPEFQSLKGKLLSHFGSLRLRDGLLGDAEELLNEGLECAETCSNLTVKATVLYTLGLIRIQYEDFLRAETTLRQALNLRERWFGKSHPLVADILFSLAELIGNSSNDVGYDRQMSETLYRQVVQIRETCLGKDHLLLATSLLELGKLLKNGPSYQKKTEAIDIFRRSLDIRTTQLGGDHIDTRAVRSYLNKLEVTLKMGQYDIATMKVIPRDSRSHEQPFSSLSWRDDDLNYFSKKQKSRPTRTKSQSWRDSRPNSGKDDAQSYKSGASISRLSSASYMSASERLHAENQRTRLLHRGKVTRRLKHDEHPRQYQHTINSPDQTFTVHKHREYTTDSVGSKVRSNPSDLLHTAHQSTLPEDSANPTQYIEPQVSFQNQQTFPSPASSEHLLFDQVRYLDSVSAEMEFPIESDTPDLNINRRMVPSPPKRQLTIEIPSGNEFKQDPSGDGFKQDVQSADAKNNDQKKGAGDHQTRTIKSSSPTKSRARSVTAATQLFNRYGSSMGSRSAMSLRSASYSHLSARRGSARSSASVGTFCSVRSHQSHCDIPGAHSIHKSNSRTVTMGPNCSLDSLLGAARCPRDIDHEIHHKSAWYHVPGRYITPKKQYPPKRSQKSPGSELLETSLLVNGMRIEGGDSPRSTSASQTNSRPYSSNSHRRTPSVREIWAESQMEKHHGMHPPTSVVTFKDHVTFN